jgi:hypothetical protein
MTDNVTDLNDHRPQKVGPDDVSDMVLEAFQAVLDSAGYTGLGIALVFWQPGAPANVAGATTGPPADAAEAVRVWATSIGDQP